MNKFNVISIESQFVNIHIPSFIKKKESEGNVCSSAAGEIG